MRDRVNFKSGRGHRQGIATDFHGPNLGLCVLSSPLRGCFRSFVNYSSSWGCNDAIEMTSLFRLGDVIEALARWTKSSVTVRRFGHSKHAGNP